jgi:hypothetical protein
MPAGSLRNRSHNGGNTGHVRSKWTATHTSGERLHQTLHVESLGAQYFLIRLASRLLAISPHPVRKQSPATKINGELPSYCN